MIYIYIPFSRSLKVPPVHLSMPVGVLRRRTLSHIATGSGLLARSFSLTPGPITCGLGGAGVDDGHRVDESNDRRMDGPTLNLLTFTMNTYQAIVISQGDFCSLLIIWPSMIMSASMYVVYGCLSPNQKASFLGIIHWTSHSKYYNLFNDTQWPFDFLL